MSAEYSSRFGRRIGEAEQIAVGGHFHLGRRRVTLGIGADQRAKPPVFPLRRDDRGGGYLRLGPTNVALWWRPVRPLSGE